MNTPSYWLKKPSPMAAPRLARAGKHAAQPIAVTMAPITPALSAVRVRGLGMDMGMALDASVLNGGGVASIRRGADECLRAGLCIIGGHKGFLLVEQDLGLFDTGNLGQRFLDGDGTRSEEHTSELQSLMRISYADF